jgi:rubrerythrin
MKRVIPEYKSLVDILQDAVDKEKDAERYYREAADMAQDDKVKHFLVELAEMEKEHAVRLGQMLEQLRADQTVIDGILSSYGDEESEQES